MSVPKRPVSFPALLLFALVTLWLLVVSAAAFHWLFLEENMGVWAWSTYPWMISWPGYYVRRGLVGEVIQLLSHAFNVDPRVTILAIYLTLSAIFAYCMVRVSAGQPLLALAILGSSFGMAFNVVDAGSTLRHESFFLAAYSAFCLAVVRERHRLALAIMTASALLLPLIHEGIALYFPFFLLVWQVLGNGPAGAERMARGIGLLWAAVMLVTGVLAMKAGGEDTVRDICREISSVAGDWDWPGRCEDAPPLWFYRNNGLRTAIHYVLEYLVHGVLNGHVAAIYTFAMTWLITFALSDIQFLAGHLLRARRTLFAAFVVPMVLFILGVDWARWVHAYHLSLGILVISLSVRHSQAESSSGIAGTWRSIAVALLVAQPLFVGMHHLYGQREGLAVWFGKLAKDKLMAMVAGG
ncbi:hypothetical protein HRbin39_00295 [bacterium HR39]|nr:hypothetical protein HRbin39_00295 [bacterium HR39]